MLAARFGINLQVIGSRRHAQKPQRAWDEEQRRTRH
jgi:hypothetical protein